MNDVIRVGLVGYGVGGQIFHAPVIAAIPGFELAAVRAVRPDQVSRAHSIFPQARVVSDPATLFDDPQIGLIVIATPNTFHFSLASAALRAGKHVVVDKPFTIDTTEADQLIELADKMNCLLTVHHNRRWDGDYLTVSKILDSGMLGELVEFESHYDRFRNNARPGAWREQEIPGSGIFYDLGSHLIDQALMLFGLPEAVTADIRTQRKTVSVNDNFELLLHYDRLKVTLKAGMLVREPLPRFLLQGSQGSYLKYGMDPQEDDLKAGLNPVTKNNWGVEPAISWGRINTDWRGVHFVGNIETEPGDYTAFYRNVHQAITTGAGLMVTAKQARNTIRILELGMQSHRERKTINWSARSDLINKENGS